jgi:hypothetical protein
MKIHPVEAELFYAGRLTDRTKPIATSNNSANTSKKVALYTPCNMTF